MGMRRLAREIAVQTLYEMTQSGAPLRQALSDNLARRNGDEGAADYAQRLLDVIAARTNEIRSCIDVALANWSWDRVALVDRCVLQIATAEILAFPDIPVRVSIDEAVEIARKFSTDDSGAFVNGVLDRVARESQAGPDVRPVGPEADA